MDRKTPSFCSGVMLFNPSDEIKDLFKKTLEHIFNYIKSGKKFGTCVDQPFINFNTIIRNVSKNERRGKKDVALENRINIDEAEFDIKEKATKLHIKSKKVFTSKAKKLKKY